MKQSKNKWPQAWRKIIKECKSKLVKDLNKNFKTNILNHNLLSKKLAIIAVKRAPNTQKDRQQCLSKRQWKNKVEFF